MSWIQKLQNKTPQEKMRIIWIAVIVALVCMVLLWIGTSRIGKNTERDTTLFKTIGRGIKDIKDNYKK